MKQMAEDETDVQNQNRHFIYPILRYLCYLCSMPYFSEGMMIPRMITFWQKMKTRSVGIAVSTRAA